MEEIVKVKKICTKCGEEKELNEFSKRDKSKDGCRAQCKKCVHARVSVKTKIYRENNKEIISIRQKKYRIDNLEKIKEKEKLYIDNNKEKVKERRKKYGSKNREILTEKHRAYKLKNIDYFKKYDKEYKLKNKEKQNKQRRDRFKDRYTNDIIYRIKVNTRNRVKMFLKTKTMQPNNGTFKMLGCTPEELRLHLENQFVDGMSWNNYGRYGWHIDHIIPISSAKTEDDVYKLTHYLNLQPLWAKDNYDKGSKMIIND